MEMSKEYRDLFYAKRRLDVETTYETTYRGVPLERFTAQELIKIIGIAMRYSDVFAPSKKVIKPFRVADRVYYKGCVHRISDLCGKSASIRQSGESVSQVVLLKDLTHASENDNRQDHVRVGPPLE